MGIVSLEIFREELKTNGIRVHGNNFVIEGEKVIANKDTLGKTGKSIKGQVFKIMEIVVDSQEGNGLGFSKRIKLDGQGDKLFNPQSFSKFNEQN